MAICSASTKDACVYVLDSLLGKENLDKFDLVLAGDDVPRRKPDPMIYTLASEKLGVPPERWAFFIFIVATDLLFLIPSSSRWRHYCIF